MYSVLPKLLVVLLALTLLEVLFLLFVVIMFVTNGCTVLLTLTSPGAAIPCILRGTAGAAGVRIVAGGVNVINGFPQEHR